MVENEKDSRVIHVPELEHSRGSWVVSRKTGEVVGEFFNRRDVERFNLDTCLVETTLQYLLRINGREEARSGTRTVSGIYDLCPAYVTRGLSSKEEGSSESFGPYLSRT
jgi:hypothetical protein